MFAWGKLETCRAFRGASFQLAREVRQVENLPHNVPNGSRAAPSDRLHLAFFSILAHVSRSVTARLNTSFAGVESRSTQK